MSVLRVTDLTVRYAPGVRAVQGAGLTVAAGEVLGVVGESGSGKTALALAVMGLLPDDARVTGSVRLRGRELLGRSDAELSRVRGKDLAMVFQDPLSALTPVHTVGDQIAETVRIHARVSRAAARARAVALLDLVGIPGAQRRARAYPHELSGGMRQRVMIAMAIANDPAVVIADEPTAALDATVQAQVLDVLRVAKEATGAAIVLITHDPGVVAGFSDRVMVMHAGRSVESGPVEELLRRPGTPYTNELLRASSPARESPVPPSRPERPAVLDVDGLVRHHALYKGPLRLRQAGSVRAVDGIGFRIREGETLALVGESGSGKTTTLMEILRLSRPQGGRVALFGRDTATLRASDRKALRRDVQVVFQDPFSSLNPRMRVADILAEPLTAHGMPTSRARARVEALVELVGLEPAHARRYPHALSGGQRQRVGIARALALEPRLLLLDEPVAALDVIARAEVLGLLERLRERLGMACLLVTHDIGVVRRLADQVAVMYAGRLVEIGPADGVCGDPAHPYTRALLDAVPLADPCLEQRRPRVFLRGDPPDPASPPAGCRFRSRCPRYAMLTAAEGVLCEEDDPESRPVRPGEGAGHSVACHHPLAEGESAP
ncbi:dipeptide ABC transporter ATP-binding protein [Actinomadura livida]|uniref:ABC transporter ATP-binding protein n=1 Tax=Actinomadura livida TaxID=79909 RepID=A0A7W7IGI3_9ACTN|nr:MULTISPECIES: ABC transporter ATP-binding protein [Actinomadura]MBB4776702.1 peptide/nickel transport system ATP-binding protein [Actinomadura catellatispora]GGT94216.1 ABC transporter ATP-binding protein [Actinomadura livida]